MARHCEICGKTAMKANKISFSHKQHKHLQVPNLQSVKTNDNGTVKRITACTSCLKANKVRKAL